MYWFNSSILLFLSRLFSSSCNCFSISFLNFVLSFFFLIQKGTEKDLIFSLHTVFCHYCPAHTLLAPREYIFIVATKWMVARLLTIVEAQLRRSRDWVARLICKMFLRQRTGETSTISQLSLNSGATNGDCNSEMASVRDNGAANNDDITTTPQQKVAQCHLNYKATKWRQTFLHRSVLLLRVFRLL